jgi:hypothetical protein
MWPRAALYIYIYMQVSPESLAKYSSEQNIFVINVEDNDKILISCSVVFLKLIFEIMK